MKIMIQTLRPHWFFKSEADFTQRIKLLTQDTTLIKGSSSLWCVTKACVCRQSGSMLSWCCQRLRLLLKKIRALLQSFRSRYWSIFLIAFGGFVALHTLCIPNDSDDGSFFTKQSENKAAGIRNAIIYGLSIIFIYVILGVAVSAIFGADALNNMATNVYFNIAFFLLLVIFAASFLGAFELTMLIHGSIRPIRLPIVGA